MKEASISEHTTAKAKALVEERFSKVDLNSPVFRVLFDLSVEHVAKDMVDNPKRYAPRPEVSMPGTHFDAIDPVTLLQDEIKLPSLPQIFIELKQVMNDPSSSAADLADVISQDTGLSAFLLRMVNSAFYSFPSQIDTISRAVAVIGTRQLSTLALGTSVMDMFKDMAAKAIDLELFWQHSFACGTIARELASILGNASPERCFVAGILHDIGRPVLINAMPERAIAAADISEFKKAQLHRAERITIGFDHAHLGGMLLRKWNLPFPLVSAVLYHHNPNKAKKYPEARIVYFSNIITKALGIGTSGDFIIPDIPEEYWESSGINAEVLATLISRLDTLLESAFSILESAA
jgi:putative nucleotidyltransferase with HDIG domain